MCKRKVRSKPICQLRRHIQLEQFGGSMRRYPWQRLEQPIRSVLTWRYWLAKDSIYTVIACKYLGDMMEWTTRSTNRQTSCIKCSIRPNAIREFFQSLNNLLWHIPISRSPQATRVICTVYLPSNTNSKNNWFSSIITLNLSFIKWIKYHYESKFICIQSWRSHFSFGITFSLLYE